MQIFDRMAFLTLELQPSDDEIRQRGKRVLYLPTSFVVKWTSSNPVQVQFTNERKFTNESSQTGVGQKSGQNDNW